MNGAALLAGLERLRPVVPVVEPRTQGAGGSGGSQHHVQDVAAAAGTPSGAPGHTYEAEMLVEFPDPLTTPNKPSCIVGVCGQVDWAGGMDGREYMLGTAPTTEPDMIEIKFVSELGADHRLQALVYAALHASTHPDQTSSVCLLFNARTGERESVRMSAQRAGPFLADLARFKLSGVMPAAGAHAAAEAESAFEPLAVSTEAGFDDDL